MTERTYRKDLEVINFVSITNAAYDKKQKKRNFFFSYIIFYY